MFFNDSSSNSVSISLYFRQEKWIKCGHEKKMKKAMKEVEDRFSFFLFLFRHFEGSEEGNPSDRKLDNRQRRLRPV